MNIESPTRARRRNKGLVVRLIILSAFVALVNWWTIRHIGFTVKDLLIANGLWVGVGFISTLYPLFTESERSDIKVICRDVLSFFLKAPTLVVLYILFLIFGSLFTSVTVVYDEDDKDLKVFLYHEPRPENQEALLENQAKTNEEGLSRLQSTGLIWPWGRSYRLKFEGYHEKPFKLYPFWGRTIEVNRDLVVAPTILLRFPRKHLQLLGQAKVVVETEKGIALEVKTKTDHGSIRIGRHRNIPESMIERWKDKLSADVDNEAVLNKILQKWKEVQPESSSIPLFPDMKLKVKIIGGNGQVKMEEAYVLSPDRIQDILLEKES